MPNNDTPSDESETDKRLRTDGGVASDGDGDEPVPKTFYLKASTKRSVNRWLKQLELDHREIEDAQRHHQYEAIVQLAMEHEDEFIELVDELS